MFKWIVLISKRKDLSREEFIDYYENFHVPLLRRILPRIEIYRRNYICHDDAMFAIDDRGGNAEDYGFDVVTEAIFNTRAEAEALMAAFADPDIFRQVKEDEAEFVEPGCAKMFVVEVRE